MSLSNRASQSKRTIDSIFYDVQFSKSNHPSCKKILTSIYQKSNIKEFLTQFLKCLETCLLHEEKSTPNVERTLDFAADFAVSFSLQLGDDEACPLLEGVFQFIFENHDCAVPVVRLRICQMMNRLLDAMGHDATVAEEVYNRIAESMLVRLQDSMTSVRTQAVYALHRLQEPANPKCDIIQAFMYHMSHDPCPDVRRAVVQKVAVNKMTLSSILTRLNDVKDSVRKEAYTIVNRFLIRQFTIRQRQLILDTGLHDRCESIRNYMTDTLIPNWLKYFNYNYYEFLECIHIEKIPELGIKLLKAIFSKQREVVMESRLQDMFIINQQIPYNKLDIITVLYWRALAEYLKPTDDNDKHEHIFRQVLPDLTPFCDYIKGYYFPSPANQTVADDSNTAPTNVEASESQNQESEDGSSVQKEADSSPSKNETPSPEARKADEPGPSNADKDDQGPHKPNETVLVHLLEICRVYDLADEMGRSRLRQLCGQFLQSCRVTLASAGVLASLLDHTVPDTTTKLTVMAEIISELREPLQPNDTQVYVPGLLLQEAEDKKAELNDKITELDDELEVVEQLGDEARVSEIKTAQAGFREELRIMDTVAPDEFGGDFNNDPDTLKKCLTIVVEILKKGSITKMNSTLYSLMQNFVLPTLNLKIEGEAGDLIKNLALKALGIFCVLDGELAKEHFMVFCFNIANETLSVTSLECVFDLLHVYGLAAFNIEDPDEGSLSNSGNSEEQRRPNLVVLLTSLLNSESQQMRKTAVIGLCKLLFTGRVKSAELITKLIILWYSPGVENDATICQPLGVFFPMLATTCRHAPELLLQAFLPTIRELFKLEVTDPLAEIEVENVANLLVDLTRPGDNPHTPKDLHLHNQIAINLCEEVLSEEWEPANCLLLVKVMSSLEIDYDRTTDISILRGLLTRMVQTGSRENKALAQVVAKMDTTVKVRQEQNRSLSTINNTLPPDTSIRTTMINRTDTTNRTTTTNRTNGSTFLLAGDSSDSESNMEAEDEDDPALSQDMSICRPAEGGEDIIIPGTPDQSDSDSDSVFTGFCPLPEKIPRLSQELESGFKLPPIPSKLPSRESSKTPRKTKTPSKAQTVKGSRTPRKAYTSSPTKSKTPAKIQVASPSKTKTPAKVSVGFSKPKTAVNVCIASTSKSISPNKSRISSPVKSPLKNSQSSPTKGKTTKKEHISSLEPPKSSGRSRFLSSSSESSPMSSPIKQKTASPAKFPTRNSSRISSPTKSPHSSPTKLRSTTKVLISTPEKSNSSGSSGMLSTEEESNLSSPMSNSMRQRTKTPVNNFKTPAKTTRSTAQNAASSTTKRNTTAKICISSPPNSNASSKRRISSSQESSASSSPKSSPFKGKAKALAKRSKTPAKTPAKTLNSKTRTTAPQKEVTSLTPESSSSTCSPRVTRSSRKQKT